MSKCSPYISCASITIGLRHPAAIGCPGATVHTSLRSPSLRHSSPHDVPISALEDLRVVARSAARRAPISPSTRFVHARDHRVVDLVVRGVAPPGEHVGPGEHLLAETVLGLLGASRCARSSRPPRACGERGRDRRVHARRDRSARTGLVALLVDVLAPDGHAHRHPHQPTHGTGPRRRLVHPARPPAKAGSPRLAPSSINCASVTAPAAPVGAVTDSAAYRPAQRRRVSGSARAGRPTRRRRRTGRRRRWCRPARRRRSPAPRSPRRR